MVLSRTSIATTLFAAWLPAMAVAVDVSDTLMLTQPAISADRIAFVYAGDLWIANRDGSGARRLTADQGDESSPAFSPDGKLVAFSAQYEGNVDVFVVPAEGGVPARLTWHPDPDIVQGFSADGAKILFTSPRAVFTNRYTQLWTVPAAGGLEEPLPIPHAFRASYSPDGKRIAYNPLSPSFLQWKRYRGGRVSTITLYTAGTHATESIPQPAGRCNDADPMWMGDTVYFRSDRNGEFNLFAFDTKSRQVSQLTSHADFPVLAAAAGGGRIVYEQGGRLHLFDPQGKTATPLKIAAAADLGGLRPRFAKGTKWVRNGSLSPSGARAALEFRGEIVTVPAEKGDPRNLTNTLAAHERSPAWSPDGKQIAYFSDESGEYALHVRAQDAKGDVETFKLPGAGFYDLPQWSPDSRKIAFADNAFAIYWLDLSTGAVKKVHQEVIYGPRKSTSFAWSPDSKWLAYTTTSRTYIQSMWMHSIDTGKSSPITDGLSDVTDPVFDKNGKYLYFFASTDAGPVKDWFSQANADMRATRAIYLAVLRNDLPNPLAKESDEEKGPSEEKKDEKKDEPSPGVAEQAKTAAGQKETSAGKTGEEKPAAVKKDEPVRIDFDGIQYRIVALPIASAELASLQVGPTGQVFYLRRADEKSALNRYDLKTRKNETLIPELDQYQISFDGKKIAYRTKDTWFITALQPKIEPGGGKVNIDAVEVRIDPRAEWKQIFDEAWRINRDFFYDPGMHGADWRAVHVKYTPFLEHAATRSDLNRVIQWMCSELTVGHSYLGGGDSPVEVKRVPGGLLGADYSVENGRYRLKKVYGGLNWNPTLRAPLTEPGVNARAGEYLLAVNGRDVRPPASVYSFFENTADKAVEITLGPSPDGADSRTVTVVPVESESALRNRDWVEGNLRKVHDATGGRVAYVYVPNTAGLGHTYFKRYFFPQADKDAIIVDERFNGGGSVADYYIDILRRSLVSYWAMRYGEDLRTPIAGILGPKVMLADETAGSGGDLLPWMFKKFRLGPVVGKRTWGGLVGILGFPVLMDGGQVTAPNLAIWTEDGWIVENEGVPPDIEVEQTVADVIAGRDPQLERAIEIVKADLARDPPPKPKRPPFPIRVREAMGTR